MNYRVVLIGIALLVCAAQQAFAAGTLTVGTTPLSFGIYDIFLATPLDGQGEVQVTFIPGPNPNPPFTYTITISASPNSGSINPRSMKQTPSSVDVLSYNVYTDAARTVIWNDVITGGTDNIRLTNRRNIPQPQRTPVYGRIPAMQDVGPGLYSDSLTVTITW